MDIRQSNQRIGAALAACAIVFTSTAHSISLRSYDYEDFKASLAIRHLDQAAERLRRCANSKRAKDHDKCVQRVQELKEKFGGTIESGLREEIRISDGEAQKRQEERDFFARIDEWRHSKEAWDKYLLFSELTAGRVQPIDPDEISRVGREAFDGFAVCARQADPSCMGMYGELILRGADSLNAAGKAEARRKAIYWLNLSARYGYEPARRALISEGEQIPTPDLAMEQLQKEANVMARNAADAQERQRREESVRHYELIRATRRQTEIMMWSTLFPKYVSCTSNSIGSNTYTNCH